MMYNKKILAAAWREQKRDCAAHEERLAARKRKIYEKQPRIRAIEREMASTSASVLRVALMSDGDPEEAIYRLRDSNLALQRERESLLLAMNLPKDYLVDKPLCPKCKDTGYVNTQLCECMIRRYKRLLQRQLAMEMPMDYPRFDSFRMDYYSKVPNSQLDGYSAYDNMQRNLQTSKRYAETFSKESGNLLLFGSTGLGKTFLSTCIANVVAAQGFSVIYDTVNHIIAVYEVLRFPSKNKTQDNQDNPDNLVASERVAQYENADLLIIDDMGAELINTFTVSVLYHLINSRLISHSPMIINTCLHPREISKKYSRAISSRLRGEFELLRFVGDDIRERKRNTANP